MKKYCIIFLLLFGYQAASSQVIIALVFGDKLNTGKLEFGLMTGPAYTGLSNTASNSKFGFNLGLYFNYKLNDRWFLHPEMLPKVSFGAKDIPVYSTGDPNLDILYKGGSVTRNIKAMSVPLLVRYRIAGSFYAEAGPQFDLITQVKDVFTTTVNDNELEYTIKVKDQFTRLDAGYALGLAYRLHPGISGVTLGVRYYGGLTDIMKSMQGTQVNSSWNFNVYIPIGASKSSSKKTKNK
jgi:hypothetical protein